MSLITALTTQLATAAAFWVACATVITLSGIAIMWDRIPRR